MNIKNVSFQLILLLALLSSGCSKQGSDIKPSDEDSEPTVSEQTSDEESEEESEEPVRAQFEVTSNLDVTPRVEFQDSYYYVGETVRFRIADTQYSVSKVVANDVELTKGTGAYPYNFVADEFNTIELTLANQYKTEAKNVVLTFDQTTSKAQEQIYNFWPEQSGISYDIATKSTHYKITFELSIDADLIDDEDNNISGLGYGDNDEIQINIPMFFTQASASAKSYGFNIRMFKYKDVWVYRPLHGVATATKPWSGDLAFDDHRNDTTARKIVSGLSRGGVKFTYEFNQSSVTATALIGEESITIGTCNSMTIWNGQDNGDQQMRYMDLSGEFSTTLTKEVKLSIKDFVVDFTPLGN